MAPSLLACDFTCMGKQIDQAIAGEADVLHVDVMDGHLVTNLSMGPPVMASVRNYTDCPLDVHLMLTDPAYYIESFADAGADSITFHIEATDEPAKLVARLRELGLGAGVTMKPATPASAIVDVINDVDMVLVMTVEPGYGGQAFMDDMLDKIREIRSQLRPDQRLQVDGGIGMNTIKRCWDAGADVFVAGNSVFRADDIAQAICDIRGEIGQEGLAYRSPCSQ